MTQRAQPMLRKWYFCVNAQGFDEAWPLLKVAVRSGLARTDLEPVCLYNGDVAEHRQRLRGLGAQVIAHQSRLADVLSRGYGDLYDTYSGHWLRLDIPFVEQSEDIVLYTDIDVMFRSHPTLRRVPRFLAAAPERYRWRWPHFNSGVLVMNLPALRAFQPRFDAAITARMAKGWQPPGHDQVSYNSAFRWRHQRLPHVQNWKPYWGPNKDAQIVHFHGPKPKHIDQMAAGSAEGLLPVYKTLWQLNPKAYALFVREFNGFEADG